MSAPTYADLLLRLKRAEHADAAARLAEATDPLQRELHACRMAVLAHEIAGMEAPAEFFQLAGGELEGPACADDEHIVCWFEGDSIALTPALWARIVAERKRMGRVLQHDDVKRIADQQSLHDLDRHYPHGSLRIQGAGSPSPSMRRARCLDLAGEVIPEASCLGRVQLESHPAEALASEPDAEAAVDASSDVE